MQRFRLISRSLHVSPSSQIAQFIKRGNYYGAIELFIRTPSSERSVDVYEQIIQACAHVPDAVSARAVLRSMPAPTATAAGHVVTAFCRERKLKAAVDLVEQLPSMGIEIDHRVTSSLFRAARRDQHIMTRLQLLPRKKRSADREYRRQVVAAEGQVRSARGDIAHVENIWRRFQQDSRLKGEIGILASTVSAFIGSGREGGPKAVNALMTWAAANLDPDNVQNRYTQNPTSMALLLTSSTKALAKCAPCAPRLALNAYDALYQMRLPLFQTSLPLTGTYFKILQHARLPLPETLARIEEGRKYHIQLDEQAFSMALGAILRCNARLVDRLAEGRKWVELMRSAAIPLTVQTYNLLAGQLRYCNDPTMVTALLSDMSEAGITPTAVTYGLIFSACVMPGDYASSARKTALPVSVWARVLQAMSDHMEKSEVLHTPNSRLSLARAYAHLGRTTKAMEEFNHYLVDSQLAETSVSSSQVNAAYHQMLYNFAHCRDCSSNGPQEAISIYEMMRKAGLAEDGSALDSLTVAFVRTGKTQQAVDFAEKYGCSPDAFLSGVGFKHLLKACIELREPFVYETLRPVIAKNKELLSRLDLKSTVEELVISFARCQRRDLCEEVMNLAGIEVADLDYILKGREFLRFRKFRGLSRSGADGLNGTSAIQDSSATEQFLRLSDRSSRSVHNDAVLPTA